MNYDYSKTIVHKIYMADPDRKGGSRVYIDFSQALELIRPIDAITQEMPKIVYLVGWQYNGHDDGYPEMFEVNKALKRPEDETALDSYLWLVQEAKKYHTVVSVHVNFMDAYDDSPLFPALVEHDAIIRNRDGSLRCVEEFNEKKGYKISTKHYWESGLFQQVADRFLAYLPVQEAKTLHVDAWHVMNQYSPYTPIIDEIEARNKMWDYLISKGLDVTVEGVHRELDDRLDAPGCPYVEKEGHTPEELAPGRWKEVEVYNLGKTPYVWWYNYMTDDEIVHTPASVLAGFPSQNRYRRVIYGLHHGEDIWMKQYKNEPRLETPKAWIPLYIKDFCELTIPYFYLNQFTRQSLVCDASIQNKDLQMTLTCSDNVVCKGEDASITRNGITLKREGDLLLPIIGLENTFVAYSEKGRNGQWPMPDASFDTADVYEITEFGNRYLYRTEIQKNEITLHLKEGQALIIRPARG